MEKEIVKLNKRKNLVSYSRDLAEARYSLTLMEQKLVWAMTSLISPNDENFKTYKVDTKLLAEYIGIDKKSVLRELDKVTDSLMGRVLRIPIEDGNKLLKVHWVSRCILDKKYVEFAFDQAMRPYLLKLKTHFTSHLYRILVSFRGTYTIRIYQLLKIYEYKGRYECSLDNLRSILDVGIAYPAFKEFRRNVINPAKKEFQTKNKETGTYQSDITFDLETIRTGRKITHLCFIIKKQAYQEALPLDMPEQEVQSQAVQALVNYGISDALARSFEEEQGETSILRCAQMYEEQLNAGKVTNKSGGYLLSMLKAGAGKQTKAEIDNERKARKSVENKAKAEQKKQEQERLKAAYEKVRNEAITDFLGQRNETELTDIIKVFEASDLFKNEVAEIGFALRKYKEEGIESRMIISCYKRFLVRDYLPSELQNFEQWIKL